MRGESFGPREVDALQELASIGCGRAITALGTLAGRRLEMDVPEAWVGAETGAIAAFLGALGQEIVAVGVKLLGRLQGDLLLALPERDAEALAAVLGFPVTGGTAKWTAMAESALLESGNIVGSAFVSAVAALVREKLLLSVPSLARGSGRRCVETLVAHAGSVALATRFSCRDGTPDLEGLILVMPDPEGIASLLGHLLSGPGD
ncbi:MAG TPA: chemotaxis protein CheC [Anaeromyxobacter sp.]|nr:chemotaxis protein CheC [Anaeromyxobacter sp.]